MMSSRLTTAAKHLLGPRWTAVARVLSRGDELPEWGNMRRLRPFSEQFGFDRGTPIDRFYLHRFLETERASITGAVLEIQVASYAERFGHDLKCVHTLDISSEFSPTYHCDLANADSVIGAASYDCFLLPNTLQHLERLDDALGQALRVVKPGGVILASAANLVRLNSDADDFWRLSAAGWRRTLERIWRDCIVEVRSHGNCLAAVAALYGLAVEELAPEELTFDDGRFPVLTTIKCMKPVI
jgi:SAM-dependent methyltransferase